VRLSVWFFGVEVFAVGSDAGEMELVDLDEPGSWTSMPVGFAPSPGDQRWESGAGEGDV
jgi:hypothetical protein